MKPTKVIDRLVAFAPPFIAAVSRHRSRCVLATAIGIDVLDAFGLASIPVPVRMQMANGRYLQAVARGLSPATAVATGARLLVTADADEVTPGNWGGHLMIGLPERALLIDLDFQQFERPDFPVDAAEVFDWPSGTVEREFRRPDGSRLVITATDDRTFETAKDWRADRADVVAALVRAIRRGGRS